MAPITFDTRKVVRNLKVAGFDEVQADAIVDTVAEAFSDTVATKADIAEVQAELKATATKANVAELKADMFKVAIAIAVGIVVANVSLTVILVGLLLR